MDEGAKNIKRIQGSRRRGQTNHRTGGESSQSGVYIEPLRVYVSFALTGRRITIAHLSDLPSPWLVVKASSFGAEVQGV